MLPQQSDGDVAMNGQAESGGMLSFGSIDGLLTIYDDYVGLRGVLPSGLPAIDFFPSPVPTYSSRSCTCCSVLEAENRLLRKEMKKETALRKEREETILDLTRYLIDLAKNLWIPYSIVRREQATSSVA